MSISNPNLPKLVVSLRQYSRQMFLHDLLSGITVGLVALPLAMAFGIASGVTPQAGLYTAVVAGFLISALGGSRTQIGGPTGAFVVIVAGIVARFGLPGLAMVTVMAGIILLAMGLTGLGSAIRFIPRPVIIGFTNGIAVLIASTQIKDFFGLRVGAVPSEFLPRMKLLIGHISSLNWQALAIGVSTLAIMLVLPGSPGAFPHPSLRCWRAPWHAPCFICRLKPSAPVLVESLAACRPSPFRIFMRSTFSL
jgi:SulP family sulfate permease